MSWAAHLARSATTALLLGSVAASALAAPIRVSCRDGGRSGLIEAFGHQLRVDSLDLCDVDGSCDGICSVRVPQPRDVRCWLVGGSGCSGFGIVPRLTPYCPSPTAAVRRGHQRTFFNGRVVVQCVRPKRCALTPTTTLPPGVPDLTGSWTVTEVEAQDDCRIAPGFDFATHHQLTVLQIGTDLVACGDVLPSPTGGNISSEGFTFAGEETLPNYNAQERVSGPLPGADGTIPLMEEWTFFPLGPNGPPPVCERTARAVMSRVPEPCVRDRDCLGLDGCSRCTGGTCVLAPACR